MGAAAERSAGAVTIERLDEVGAQAALGGLAALLADAVDHGASVNFLAGLTMAEAAAFWAGQIPAVADGMRQIFVARDEAGAIVGSVVLTFAPQPNGPHRAEIGKMLVHSRLRRRGLGRALLDTAEAAARAAGRTMLMLDTATGSAGEALYRGCGWIELGTMPDHSLSTDGVLSAATFFYKRIAP
ncbi:GNAT family N-acetyltransferase [Prosthecomicrobium pneumaticum]|uniref:GNAT superfamily N-acetyltransferase n=1 Tax=Prosthecomicrobium pneumaticum TaxID=81895 RepID=A0A7W9FLU0_9HYPH|nr:GNAT family N-acetyltransferase [Prosthecomicrobium pneumaticum]MBB5753047.1 GNAT superfamily N-acetyltransferase [Prosthecomicrobium pneumaticum]